MTASTPTAARIVTPVRVALGAAVALAADVALDPAHRHVPLCPFHAATGWQCPLCGGLRSADALAHLHLAAAARANLLLVLALPLLAAWWVDWTRRSSAGRPALRISRGVVIAIVALAVVFTVVRNLPFASVLRPS